MKAYFCPTGKDRQIGATPQEAVRDSKTPRDSGRLRSFPAPRKVNMLDNVQQQHGVTARKLHAVKDPAAQTNAHAAYACCYIQKELLRPALKDTAQWRGCPPRVPTRPRTILRPVLLSSVCPAMAHPNGGFPQAV